MSGVKTIAGVAGGSKATITKVDNQRRYFFAIANEGSDPHYRTSVPFSACKTWADAVTFAENLLVTHA